jgi:hypothetical protein
LAIFSAKIGIMSFRTACASSQWPSMASITPSPHIFYFASSRTLVDWD